MEHLRASVILDQLLEQNSRVWSGPWNAVTSADEWELQVTKVVNCLHGAGIVWGDAKAANILIDGHDDAWIIDFGGGYTHGCVEKHEME